MKLWQKLYSNLMNESGADGGDGGAGGMTGNPLGNAGQADYLNNDGGDNGQDNNQNQNTGLDTSGDSGNDNNSDSADNSGLEEKKGEALNTDKGLLDDEEGKDGEGDEKTPPADADFEFEMPEGFELDDAVKADITKIAKENGVTPEAAKAFVQKHAELKQAELAQARETIAEWKKATMEDPEIGGEYLQQTMQNVKNALNVPGGSEVAEILKQTGLQNHPAFIKFLNAYGKMNRNDSNRGVSPATAVSDKQKLDAFYGN